MLEFVEDPAAVLANAAHHAEAGARFFILAPKANILGQLYRGFYRSHGIDIHLFDRNWFATFAPRSGWEVHAIDSVVSFSVVVRLQHV